MMFTPRPLPQPDNAAPAHACTEPSDLTRATQLTSFEKLYLTRLRARIPVAQIAKTDLTLRRWLSGDGPEHVSQYHQALAEPTGDVPRSNPEAACRATPSESGGRGARPRAGVSAAVATAALVLAGMLRRRRRR
jgi:hypothetical protein